MGCFGLNDLNTPEKGIKINKKTGKLRVDSQKYYRLFKKIKRDIPRKKIFKKHS